MPTTLTSLLLFVVLLLPGFAYVVGKERNCTERRMSTFRETVAIVVASITTELIVLTAFAWLRGLAPSITPDVGQLVRHGGAYLRGTGTSPGHYREVAAWSAGMLAMAVALAYTATIPAVRRRTEWLTGEYPHASTVSAWWLLFDKWAGTHNVDVTCVLDDGSCIRAFIQSFNTSADDIPDRDLILRAPIRYRPPGDTEFHDYDVSAVCVTAPRIVALFVNYEMDITSSSEEEDPAVEASAEEAPVEASAPPS